MENQYVTIGLAAKILGVSVKTVRRWCKAGKISYEVTPGGHRRFFIQDLIDHIESENAITIQSER